MLKSFNITGLFELYSYNLDFNTSNNNFATFITGPNGYGKTTILSLIHALYQYDFDYILSIPFEELKYNFEQESITIKQERPGTLYMESDIVHDSHVILNVKFSKEANGNNIVLDTLLIDSTDGSWREKDSQLKLYLQSLPLYYIKDQRLQHKTISLDKEQSSNESVSAVCDNAIDLQQKLLKLKNLFAFDENKASLFLSTKDSNINDETKNKLKTKLKMLEEWELIPKGIVSVLDVANLSWEIIRMIDKLEVFFKIIQRCKFSNKYMEISPRFGYRFIAKDEDHTILALDSLSSGEQHILIQTYELLFRAEEQSLVLIDEPEISLHLAWQLEFLQNIQDVIQLRQIQCIVGTHSPQIFSSKWNIAIDLYEHNQNIR